MSEIKVDKISPQSGTALQIGDASDVITIPASATITNLGTATGFGGGKLLDITSVTKTDVFTDNSGAWVDIPDLTRTVTNAAIGERFLIRAVISSTPASISYANYFRLIIDGTNVGMGDAGGSNRWRVNAGTMCGISTGANETNSTVIEYLYTTVGVSGHVIKIQGAVVGGSFQINRTVGDSSDAQQFVRSSSTLTVMRISA
jgi:hypothetical protein